MSKPTTVAEYAAAVPASGARTLEELLEVARSCAPGAAEVLKWGSPAFVHASGTILFVISAHRSHANVVFTPSTVEAFSHELQGHETGKGRVAVDYSEDVPEKLLRRMMLHRLREHEDDGVGWR